MGRVYGGTTGGILRAHQCLTGHEAAALYDFQSRFGKLPEDFPTHQRTLLTVGLLHDRTSRCYAAVQGWLYAPSEAAFLAYWQRDIDDYRLAAQAKKASQWKPFPRPWEPAKAAPVMGDDRRARLRAHAKRMTGGTDGS